MQGISRSIRIRSKMAAAYARSSIDSYLSAS